MLGYAVRRLGIALALIWLVATLVFLAIHLIPGDPAELLLSQGGVAPDPAAVAELRARLGLDQPLLSQYGAYLAQLARGDLGSSLRDEHAVADELLLRLPRTLELIGAAGLLAVLLGLPAGTLAALHGGRPIQRAFSGAPSLWPSVPAVVVRTVALLVVAPTLRLNPAC